MNTFEDLVIPDNMVKSKYQNSDEMEPISIYNNKSASRIHGYYIKSDGSFTRAYKKQSKLLVYLKTTLFKQVYIKLIG